MCRRCFGPCCKMQAVAVHATIVAFPILRIGSVGLVAAVMRLISPQPDSDSAPLGCQLCSMLCCQVVARVGMQHSLPSIS